LPNKKAPFSDVVSGKNKGNRNKGRGSTQKAYTGVGATGKGIPIERVKPSVLKEVHSDSRAAYGYSPNKWTAYERYDFRDIDSAKRNRKIREQYLEGSKRLESDIKRMRSEGKSSEEIGHYVVPERNEQKLEARKYMNVDEIKALEARNIKKYIRFSIKLQFQENILIRGPYPIGYSSMGFYEIAPPVERYA
jgi:hypothetical protein